MYPVLAAFSTQEFIFLGVLVFLLFGAAKIPHIARALGRAQGEFVKAKREFDREVKATSTAPTAATSVSNEPDLLARARAAGIPTEGRSLEEIRKDLEAQGA